LPARYYRNKGVTFSCRYVNPAFYPGDDDLDPDPDDLDYFAYIFTITITITEHDRTSIISRDYAVSPLALNQR
jgi:hypothetical protein